MMIEAQIGIVKNPTVAGSATTFTDSQFSSLNSIKFSSTTGTAPVSGNLNFVPLIISPNLLLIFNSVLCSKVLPNIMFYRNHYD